MQQQNPDKVFAGEGSDKIGPGQYEVKRELTDKKRGTNWHASNAKRVGTVLNKTADSSNLGPGTYNPPVNIKAPYKAKGMSSFVSRVPKGRSTADGNTKENESVESESDEPDIDVNLYILFFRIQLQDLDITI